MFYIKQENIHMTKGDNAYLTVEVYDDNDCQPIKYHIGDKLQLYVCDPYTEQVFIQKEINYGETFYFEQNDTINLSPGRYRYDIKYISYMGQTYTVLPYNYLYLENVVMKPVEDTPEPEPEPTPDTP